jgi:hypothetical protein
MEEELGPGRLARATQGAAEFVRKHGGGEAALAQTKRVADLRSELLERHQRVAARHTEAGCEWSGRSYKTSAILAKMAEKEPFLFPAWLELSPATHFFRGIGLGGDLEAVPPSLLPLRSMYLWRGTVLGIGVHALAESARYVRKVEVPHDDAGLATWGT